MMYEIIISYFSGVCIASDIWLTGTWRNGIQSECCSYHGIIFIKRLEVGLSLFRYETNSNEKETAPFFFYLTELLRK